MLVFKMKSGTYDEKSVFYEKNPDGIFCDMRKIPFSERLKEAIGEETVRSFSRKCGLSEATLRDYLKGASYPTIDRLQKIAITADRTMSWFIGDLNTINDEVASYTAGSGITEEFVLIPGYMVQVSAGHGTLSHGEQEPYQHLPFPRKWLRKRGFYEDELAIVWCKGDSMEPTISDSATLVVHLGRTRPTDGRIYVVRNDDQLWVKRLQVRPDAWVLISDNAIYPPMTIKKHEQHTFEVIGQVVHIAHDVGE